MFCLCFFAGLPSVYASSHNKSGFLWNYRRVICRHSSSYFSLQCPFVILPSSVFQPHMPFMVSDFPPFKCKCRGKRLMFLSLLFEICRSDCTARLLRISEQSCRLKHTKRTNYLSWQDYFMSSAYLAAMRSKDPNTQVKTSSLLARQWRIIFLA